MTVFFDTSILVAVFYADHPSHDASMAVFRSASTDRACCALHTLAELYAVMTRLPVKPMIPPEQGVLFLESLLERVSVVTLDAEEYHAAIQEAANVGVAGGGIHDALILRCARKSEADRIYTLNRRDFVRLGPELADRIRMP